MSTVAKSYSAKDIVALEGLEPVRKRPGMAVEETQFKRTEKFPRSFYLHRKLHLPLILNPDLNPDLNPNPDPDPDLNPDPNPNLKMTGLRL